MLLTVHDFHFCLWKTSLEEMKEPIFRSKYTENSYNTCGAFSPPSSNSSSLSRELKELNSWPTVMTWVSSPSVKSP